MTTKKRSIGITKDWRKLAIPSDRAPRQNTRDVYPKGGSRGKASSGEDPSRKAGIARTNRPADRERENEAAMSARGGKPDGRSPVRGQGVFDSSFDNRPPASQTREPMQRRQRRRGDGSLAPVDADE
jgi:hypothetical protein